MGGLFSAAMPIPSHTGLALLAVLIGGAQLPSQGHVRASTAGMALGNDDGLRGRLFFFYQYDSNVARV